MYKVIIIVGKLNFELFFLGISGFNNFVLIWVFVSVVKEGLVIFLGIVVMLINGIFCFFKCLVIFIVLLFVENWEISSMWLMLVSWFNLCKGKVFVWFKGFVLFSVLSVMVCIFFIL